MTTNTSTNTEQNGADDHENEDCEVDDNNDENDDWRIRHEQMRNATTTNDECNAHEEP